MYNSIEDLDKLIKKSKVVWASNGKKLVASEWEKFKEYFFEYPVDFIMEGLDFPVSEDLYLKNVDNPYWLP